MKKSIIIFLLQFSLSLYLASCSSAGKTNSNEYLNILPENLHSEIYDISILYLINDTDDLLKPLNGFSSLTSTTGNRSVFPWEA